MLADTTDARRGERKAAPPIFDTAGEAGHEEGRMQFSLLSKRGNKQQVGDDRTETPFDPCLFPRALSLSLYIYIYQTHSLAIPSPSLPFRSFPDARLIHGRTKEPR
jgi:hypothetical protein